MADASRRRSRAVLAAVGAAVVVVLVAAGSWFAVAGRGRPASPGVRCSAGQYVWPFCPRSAAPPPGALAPQVAGGFFSASSVVNQELPGRLPAIPGSGRVATLLARHPVADIYAYGIPVYTDVDAGTPTYRIACLKDWGPCPLAGLAVPVPAGAQPSSGSDAEMVLVDRSAHRAYELWQARRSGSGWVVGWGSVVDTSGSGYASVAGDAATSGSGLAALAGLVTLDDAARRSIDHALSFSSSLTCRSFVWPASKSDGHTSPPDCIPEGTRVQLDPAVDLRSIRGITPFEVMVGRALQRYGAFAKDTGGASMALTFQVPPRGQPDPYAALGAAGDYYGLDHLPWKSLRIISG